MTPLCAVEHLSVTIGRRTLLEDVSFSLAIGERVALVGPSGSGKSTLLRVLLGLLVPRAGAVIIDGVVASNGARQITRPEDRHLAMVFQDLALWPHLDVAGNLDLVLAARGLPRSKRPALVDASLAALGIGALAGRSIATLSGGEQQRVALARALVQTPKLLLLDEPLASLDLLVRAELLTVIDQRLTSQGLGLIHVTHDPGEAKRLASRLLVLEGGRLTADGTWADLATASNTPFVRAFVTGGGVHDPPTG